MIKSNTWGKEQLIFAAKIFFLLALFGILLLIDFPIYLKLASAFLIILFLVGWFLLSFSKLQHRCQYLIETKEQQTKKLDRLSELAGELSRTPLDRDNYLEITSRLAEIFDQFFHSDRFVLFAKKRDIYQSILSHNVNLPQKGKIRIKSNSELVLKVKSQEDLTDLGFIQSGKVPTSLRNLHKQHRFHRVLPLFTESGLWGFVMLAQTTSQKSSGEVSDVAKVQMEEKFSLIVLDQIGMSLEKGYLVKKLKELDNKVCAEERHDKAEITVLNRELKRRIFDLNAVLGLVRNLYSIKEEESLFSLLAQMMQDQLGAKSVFLMLPNRENGEIVGKHFYGVHTPDLFGKDAISELRIERGRPLYKWIKNEKQIWQLYTMQKLSREDKLLQALLSSGFQIGAKLTFSGDNFGLIFLGEKTGGARYRQTDLDILAILVNMAVIAYRNIKQFKNIEELSYTDSITGLYNYRYFYKRLTEEVFRAKRFSRKLALVIFDIDDFKIYNDSYGHQAGDQLLKQLGDLLLSTVRSIDVVSRYGGEEFCVIMPESDQEECLKFMERLRKSIMNSAFNDEYRKQEHNITISLGGAIYPYDARSVDRLIYCADMALLKAKSGGKNKSVMYQEKLVPVSQ
jgi:diguanylate cyclase (GGDEF)-like protein